jgi:hypothetical protein
MQSDDLIWGCVNMQAGGFCSFRVKCVFSFLPILLLLLPDLLLRLLTLIL